MPAWIVRSEAERILMSDGSTALSKAPPRNLPPLLGTYSDLRNASNIVICVRASLVK